ncbi:uncharacterized protein LOC113279391 [Papaver somniferum]|uniref:uncharacterized protein LOC113279391 n=1 Tax=Papaver somniferum TaxID=3469 RepID=UPI000E700BC9|nr:uncharacterized protein LOC113279391 [Papaver somniferum]
MKRKNIGNELKKQKKKEKMKKFTKRNKLWHDYSIQETKKKEVKLIKEYHKSAKLCDYVWKCMEGTYKKFITGEYIQEMLFNQSLANEIIEFKMHKWMQKFESTSDSDGSLPTVFLSTLFNITIDDESLDTRRTIDDVLKNVDVKKVDHLLIPMNHHCSIPEKPECKEHFTLLYFDFQDPTWRQYNSLV